MAIYPVNDAELKEEVVMSTIELNHLTFTYPERSL